jgi:glycosyltransferase involved in cell wall biosynthesis
LERLQAMNPRFSIVIPAYNRPRELARALRSCLRQSFAAFEVLVVDDGSEEDIEAVIRQVNDSRIRYFHQSNQGAAAARNRGIQLAAGAYIAFLDSDDAFLHHKLAVMAHSLERYPDHAFCSTLFVDRGVGKLWIKPTNLFDDDDDIFEYLFMKQGWFQTSTMVLPAKTCKRFAFDESLAYGQDTQFAIDLWLQGVRFIMLKDPLVLYDDRRSAIRLSQQANVDAAGIGPYQPYLDSIERLRPHMPARAYYAWRAKTRARLVVSDAPGEALRYIWTGYRAGALTGGRTIRQLIQVFMPRLYWRLSTTVVRGSGIAPPPALRELMSLGTDDPLTSCARDDQFPA